MPSCCDKAEDNYGMRVNVSWSSLPYREHHEGTIDDMLWETTRNRRTIVDDREFRHGVCSCSL